ncbi:putative phenylalanine--tRNA ligase [Helianthus anomalus]
MPQKKEACHRFKKRKSSKWKDLQFKECNFLAKGFPIEGGYLHPLLKKPFEAKRYYSIDRVFRNVAVDRTHLAEFHQIEGLICDRGLSLGDLQGVLLDFFSCLGMSKLHFKPAYNPYTEPSMEIFGYNIVILVNNCNMETINKWVEVGNSGMFRPETLLPMCSSFQFMWQRVYIVHLASC